MIKRLVYLAILIFSVTSELYAAPIDDYVITVKTDNIGVSNNNEFTVPITRTSGSGYNVDCNDDGIDEGIAITGNNSYTCIYAVPGTYTVRVKDNNGDNLGFKRIRFYVNSTTQTDVQKLLEINQWGSAQWSSMAQAYRDAINLTVTPTDAPDFSQLTSIRQLFQNCSQAIITTTNWDTSTITNLSEVFRGASVADPDVSGWNTASVTNMKGMFQDAAAAHPSTTTNGVIWNTALVTNMRNMFRGATVANPDVTAWDVTSVTDMFSMFRDTVAFDQDMSGWNVSNLTNATSFLLNGQLSTQNYDALLTAWGALTVTTGVSFHGGLSQYCQGESGRLNLEAQGWTFQDGGLNCGQACGVVAGQLTEMQWKTISFPCDTGANGIEALLSSAIGGTYGDNNNWVVYEQQADYSGSRSSYVPLAATDSVIPGKGYWIISDHNTTWYVDATLANLNFTSVQPSTDFGIASTVFDNVHLMTLPDSTVGEQKIMLGNPFVKDFNLTDIYFSNSGGVFNQLDNSAGSATDPYVNGVVYTYDNAGSDLTAYQAITATPGFSNIVPQMIGFWLRLKAGQTGTNRLTYPLPK